MTPAQLQTLKAELVTDPASVGYQFATAADADCAAALNAPRADAVSPADVFASTVRAAIDHVELKAVLTDGTKPWAEAVLMTLLVPGFVRISNANVRQALGDLFPAGSRSRAALQAIEKRAGSRAEVLFGEGFTVTHLDVAECRRLP